MKDILHDNQAIIVGKLSSKYPDDWCNSQLIASLRQALSLVLGTSIEKPLEGIVCPGDTVVIKPNFVKEENLAIKGEWESVLTHPTVIAATAMIVAEQLQGNGKIIVADAPQTDSSIKKILRNTNLFKYLNQLRSMFKDIQFNFLDLRKEEWTLVNETVVKRRKLAGDPLGYTKINLGKRSLFANKDTRNIYGADYDIAELRKHHNDNTHEYLISNTILSADVVINISKLKTHKKAGVTLALKNFIGINGDKNYLPHHTEGTPEEGGDEFPKKTGKVQLERSSVKIYRKLMMKIPYPLNLPLTLLKKTAKGVFGDSTSTIRGGNWWGNDTIWRTTLDIHRVFLYGKANVGLNDGKPRQKYLCIIDGIIAGEGNGPMEPTPKACGLLIIGRNPLAVDYVGATIMGFDPLCIPTIKNGFEIEDLKIASFGPNNIIIQAVNAKTLQKEDFRGYIQRFEPHFGWKGKIEIP